MTRLRPEGRAPLLETPKPNVVRYRALAIGGSVAVLASVAGLALLLPGMRFGPEPARRDKAEATVVRRQIPEFLLAKPQPLAPAPPAPPLAPAAAAPDVAPNRMAYLGQAAPAERPTLQAPALFYTDPTNGAPARLAYPKSAPADLAPPLPEGVVRADAVVGHSDRPPGKAHSDVQHPPAPTMLMPGDVISAALVTAIDSDVPGLTVAQVVNDVYDHATGKIRLIPMGARLIGRYDSSPIYGQTRAIIAWHRVVMPDGRSIDLGTMDGSDQTGQAGVTDRVDSHIGPITRAIALSTAITVGASTAESAATRSNGGLVVQNAASGVSTHATEVGGRFVDKDLNRKPTLLVRQGWPVTVIVNRDLQLEPY